MSKQYKHGVILGKFMPLHCGHEHLITTGIKNSDKITVVVCSLSTEPIDGELRFNWMKNRFAKEIKDGKVNVVHLKEDWMPQEPSDCYSDEVFFGTWAGILKALAKEKIDVIFTSEDYGYPVAQYLGCEHYLVDKERATVPVSGTKVRNNPIENWQYLNEDVRKYFTKKILIIGGESTGKSTLTTDLTTYYKNNGFKSANIQEYARYWIDTVLGGDMNRLQCEHITHFGKAQMQQVRDAVEHGDFQLVFSDTDAIVSSVFQQAYYGAVEQTLYDEVIDEVDYWDLILFTQPDVPWVDDSQRNLSHKRKQINEWFLNAIKGNGSPYLIIDGNWEERLQKSIDAIDKLIKGDN